MKVIRLLLSNTNTSSRLLRFQFITTTIIISSTTTRGYNNNIIFVTKFPSCYSSFCSTTRTTTGIVPMTSTTKSIKRKLTTLSSSSSSTKETESITLSDDIEVYCNSSNDIGCNKKEKIDSTLLLLQDWVEHDTIDFHLFTNEEIIQIRTNLINWYYNNRRKLPWRGDPPPWDGSTSNFTNKKQTVVSKNNNSNKKQSTMNQFFNTTTKKRKLDKNQNDVDNEQVLSNTTTTKDNDDDSNTNNPLHKQYPITAYGIWVSEIMLQQTRVEAVIEKWCKWMISFPTVYELANATTDEVNSHWSGLGFYRRAKLLHTASQYVVNECNGIIPNNVNDLIKLPGVGRYTASAIASIAYNVPVPVVDGNVCRVLSRLRLISNNIKATSLKDVHGWTIAEQIVAYNEDNYKPGDINQALMELGATYCSPSGTGIDVNDPLYDFYWSTKLGKQIGEMILKKSDGKKQINKFISRIADKTDDSSSNNKNVCPVCAPDGIQIALENIITLIDEETNNKNSSSELLKPIDIARKCGHAVFPLSPPKNAKREEVLAVAAISRQSKNNNNDNVAWLMVRRPENNGLLAGQWEFPSICVWTSESENNEKKGTKKKRQDMSDQIPSISLTVRRKALNGLLKELLTISSSDNDNSSTLDIILKQRRVVMKDSIEHIFSHIRHTMWIEYGTIIDHDSEISLQQQWINNTGREVRWMTISDMENVGVTSAIKKILKAVNNNSQLTTTTTTKQKNNTIKKK